MSHTPISTVILHYLLLLKDLPDDVSVVHETKFTSEIDLGQSASDSGLNPKEGIFLDFRQLGLDICHDFLRVRNSSSIVVISPSLHSSSCTDFVA